MAGRKKKHEDLLRLAVEPGLGEEVLTMMAEGKQFARICSVTGLGKAGLLEWLEEPERAALASRARAQAAHQLVGESVEIADGADATNAVAVQKAKLRVQVRQWAAERWNRANYGQKVEVSGQVDVKHLHLSALQRRSLGAPGQDVTDVEAKSLEQQLLEL